MAKNRVIYFLILLSSVITFIFINTSLGFALIAGCILLPLASLCLLLLAQKGIRLSITVPNTVQEGADIPFNIEISKKNALQLPKILINMAVENQLSRSLMHKSLECRCMQGKNDKISLHMQSREIGKIIPKTESVFLYDSLGLFRKKLKTVEMEAVLVLPKLWDIEIVNRPTVEMNDEGQVYSQHKPGCDNTEIFAMHQYVPGDDIRKIHWKLSSKSDELMVRDFSMPLNYSLFLLLELPEHKVSASSFPNAVKLILSLSYSLLAEQMGHSIGWFDAKTSSLVTREITCEDDIAEAVGSLVSLSGTEYAFALQNLAEGNYLPNNAFVYYVTPYVDNGMLEVFSSRYHVRVLLPPKEEAKGLYVI